MYDTPEILQVLPAPEAPKCKIPLTPTIPLLNEVLVCAVRCARSVAFHLNLIDPDAEVRIAGVHPRPIHNECHAILR